MDSQKFTVGDSLSFGWNGMKKHFWFFFVLLVSSLVVSIIMRAFPTSDEANPITGYMAVVGAVVAVVGIFLAICINVAMIQAQLGITQGKAPSYALLKPQLMLWFKLFLVYVLTLLIKLIGFILLVIPGVYVSVRLQFVFYVVVEHGYWPFKAIAASWRMSKGHWWDLILFNIASFGVNVLGFFALLVGLFASVPTTRIAHAHVYRQLVK